MYQGGERWNEPRVGAEPAYFGSTQTPFEILRPYLLWVPFPSSKSRMSPYIYPLTFQKHTRSEGWDRTDEGEGVMST